jgi:DNA-binding NarL/FixJ family response regulator
MTIRAFLVEDSPAIRASVTDALEELAPVVVVGHAADERSATAWIRAHPQGCDVLIVDLFLNQGSGLGVLRSARNLEVHRVLFSNYATPEITRKAIEEGADRVFDKSRDIEALVQYCRALDATRR